MSKLRPQSAMLTLYGDYVLHRGGEFGIGSLIKLLGNFGLSSQAIRSAVSRMCRADILKARRAGRRSYYSLTENGHRLLTKGARRIFERKNSHWDGGWRSYPPQRVLRAQRFTLIHEYRKFPFFDPDLPRGLLPENWLRPEAAALFNEYHGLLAEKANEYFDSVFKEY